MKCPNCNCEVVKTKITKEVTDLIVQMAKEGRSLPEITKRLPIKISRQTVMIHLRRQGYRSMWARPNYEQA